jgi:GntR family transcriptional regulator
LGRRIISSAVKIDPRLSQPVYLQLAAQLRERIIFGQIKSRLPSLTELSAQTGLSIGTVRHAIRVLARENRVHSEPGRGTFVNPP